MTSTQGLELLRQIERRTGANEHEARATLRATAEALCHDLPEMDLHAIHEALGPIVPQLHARSTVPAPLHERVAEHLGVTSEVARERVQAALRALGAALPHELVTRMHRHLTDDVARHLDAPNEGEPEVTHPAQQGAARARTTMAEGRPGSAHPLSESAPDRAQRHSVARSDDPHAETKLSSARGTTQERLHETLAEGAPPHPKRTVSERS